MSVSKLSREVYNAGMKRLWMVYSHQASFPKDPKDSTRPDQERLQAWYDEFVFARWTDAAFTYCLKFAMWTAFFSQPISMLSGPKGEWIDRYENDRVGRIEKRDDKQRQETLDIPTSEEVKTLVADAFSKIDAAIPKGLTGEALEKRKREVLKAAEEHLNDQIP
jgi:hypothetical protein